MALVALLEAARALAEVGQAAMESILHDVDKGLRTGHLRLLRALAQLGPQTVPQLARSRSVTRQHIQALVNQLADRRYVERLPNPAHKRSPLFHLTETGEQLVSAVERREVRLLDARGVAVQDGDLKRAIEVMKTVREALSDERWQQLLSSAPVARR